MLGIATGVEPGAVRYAPDELHRQQPVSALGMAGCDRLLSVEHEDAIASAEEGFRRSVGSLKGYVLTEEPAARWT